MLSKAASDMFENASKFVVLLFLLLLLVPIMLTLKWALGIIAIENHMKVIEKEITSKEDTIFSYKYDYYLPTLDKERQILRGNDIDSTLEDVVLNDYEDYQSIVIKLRTDEGHATDAAETIEKVRYLLKEPVQRTFNFSAAKDTEVILVYELNCFSPDGNRLEEPIGFKVQVNESGFRPFEGWEGKIRLNWDDHLSEIRPIIETRSNHMLYEQTLKLSIFDSENKSNEKMRQGIVRRLSGKIERCSFDAMIFVRDELSAFEPKGFISYISTYIMGKLLN